MADITHNKRSPSGVKVIKTDGISSLDVCTSCSGTYNSRWPDYYHIKWRTGDYIQLNINYSLNGQALGQVQVRLTDIIYPISSVGDNSGTILGKYLGQGETT